jgi:hypothetical protein
MEWFALDFQGYYGLLLHYFLDCSYKKLAKSPIENVMT